GRRALVVERSEIREEARQLGRGAGRKLDRLVAAGPPDELLESVHERSIRRPYGGVAGAVENRRSLLGELLGQLSRKTALPGARLARDQGDAAAVAGCPREQRSEDVELPCAADEVERRAGAKRSGKLLHRGTSQF